jgi:hypothetical protein
MMNVESTGPSLLSWFGLVAAALMLIAYALEHVSHWFVIAFAATCVLGALYAFLQGAWPFGVLLVLWALVAYWRWHRRRRRDRLAAAATPP